MPDMTYEVKETMVPAGARLLLYSDGLVEAHDSRRAMFGDRRAAEVLAQGGSAAAVNERLLSALETFTGAAQEQEDDITLVTIERDPIPASANGSAPHGGSAARRVLADFEIASAPGNEREAIARLTEVVAPIRLAESLLERLRTATAEATMNAMEHGNRFDPSREVRITVLASDADVAVRISDYGAVGETISAEAPDLDAKLEGRQSPRGWGLLLIGEMVDSLTHAREDGRHVLELVIETRGAGDGTAEP
jgi:anti-sigma regulatory factor (Ser/Thr protein kinase)